MPKFGYFPVIWAFKSDNAPPHSVLYNAAGPFQSDCAKPNAPVHKFKKTNSWKKEPF